MLSTVSIVPAMPSQIAPAVDVVVPTYNARETTLDCLRHLVDASIASRVVVDDVSDDGTAEAIRGAGLDGVEVVELERHLGLSHNFNAGAALGSSPYVLFLNNDVFAAPGTVDLLLEALERRPEAVSAVGRLVDADTGETQDTYRPRDFPGLAGLIVRLVGIERLAPRNPWTGGHLRHPLSDSEVRTIDQQPAGACLLVRRDALERAGGWDECFWFWYEDVDMARRLAAQGPAVYVGPAAFRHVGRHSTRHWRKHQQHRRLYHGTLRYGQVHLSRPRQVALAAVAAAICLPRVAWYRRRDPEAARVYRELLRSAGRLARGERVEPAAAEARPAAG